MDIDLAIERMLIYQQLVSQGGIKGAAACMKKQYCINAFGYLPPAYTLDFGNVIIDTNACYTVLILNYGPSKTNVRVIASKNRSMEKLGISFTMENSNLDVGDIGQLFVVFRPTSKVFPEVHTKLSEMFLLEVNTYFCRKT